MQGVFGFYWEFFAGFLSLRVSLEVMPNPFPSDEQVAAVCTIARARKTFAEVLSLIGNLNDAEWTEIEGAIESWEAVKDDYTEIEGGLLGANISPRERRLDITNEVRRKLGMAELTGYGNEVIERGAAGDSSRSRNVPIDGW